MAIQGESQRYLMLVTLERKCTKEEIETWLSPPPDATIRKMSESMLDSFQSTRTSKEIRLI